MENFNYCDWIIRKAKKTSFARFEANRRVIYLKNTSTFALASLSVSIIGLNLLVFLKDDKHFSISITILTVILSALALALSLIISQQEYSLKENEYINSAHELNRFADKMIIKRNEKDGELGKQLEDEYTSEYYRIMRSCKYNHRPIDSLVAFSSDFYVQEMNRILDDKLKENSWYKKLWFWCRSYIFDTSIFYLLSILGSYSLLIIMYFENVK